MDNCVYSIVRLTKDAPKYSPLVNAMILPELSIKTYITKIYVKIVRYLQYKLFGQFTENITQFDIDDLLEKISEVYGEKSIIVCMDETDRIIKFKSPEPITFMDGDEFIENIMREYNDLIDILEKTLPVSESVLDLEKDLCIVNSTKWNNAHKKALFRLFPLNVISILNSSVVTNIILLIHCISVGELCLHYVKDNGYYVTNSDTSKLLTVDRDVIKKLQLAMVS
jgi:hypothetical protein